MFRLYLTDVISKQAIKNMTNLTLRLLEKRVKALTGGQDKGLKRGFLLNCA